MAGIRVEHKYHRDTRIYLVPVFKKKFPAPMLCNLCQTMHLCKVVHLHLTEGAVIVSQGVLEELQMAGMPDLFIREVVAQPPGLEISNVSREQQNQTNQRITEWRTLKPSRRKSQPSTTS